MKFSTRAQLTVFAITVVSAQAPAQIDQTPVQSLSAANGEQGDQFGAAIALDGDLLAIGAPGQATGVVELHRRVGGAWQLEHTLSEPNLVDDAQFGSSVAVQGDRVVVAAPREVMGTPWQVGTVFVYERIGGAWVSTAQLASGDPHTGYALFGSAVALDGQRIVVGAVGGQGVVFAGAGAAFAFELIGGTWTRIAELRASDGFVSDAFGESVAIEGDTVLIGAPERDPSAAGLIGGAVYVFERNGAAWPQTQIVTAPFAPGLAMNEIGNALALDGAQFLVGAHETLGSNGALVFERAGGAWTLAQVLSTSMAMYSGSAVDIEGDTLVLGCRDSGSYSGAVSVWRKQASGWSERRRLLESSPLDYARLGAAVALSQGRVAAGAPERSNQTGAASVFELSPSFGELLCFGDGSGTACPCGANAPIEHGPGCAHSLQRGALLVGVGSASVAADDLTLNAVQLLPGKTAVLAYRASAANGGAGIPLHNGLLCIAGPGGRLGLRLPGAWPFTATWGPSIASQVGATAGSTTYFQTWYRDPAASCGATSNLTNAFKVTFTP